jgi:hypothetical protein
MDLIQPKGALKRETELLLLVGKICDKIRKLPHYENYKHDIEMLKLVCNLIEHSVVNKKNRAKIDKLVLAKNVYTTVFSLNPNEVKTLETNITYLLENGQIKKQNILRLIFKYGINWVKNFLE